MTTGTHRHNGASLVVLNAAAVEAPLPMIAAAVEAPLPMIAAGPVDTDAATGWRTRALKRGLDVAVAMLLLIILLPVLIAVAVAIKLESPGPVFYRVLRVGHRGRTLQMLKFRKMHDGAAGGPLTGAADPRLTRVGNLLTRTRIDELPQLWHVLRGQMSLIGPRPEDPAFAGLHHESFSRILEMRPGITGITQLAFSSERAILRPRDPVSDYVQRILPRKVELDLLYADRLSPLLDLKVLAWTLRTAVTREEVAVNRRDARITVRQPRVEFASVELSLVETA